MKYIENTNQELDNRSLDNYGCTVLPFNVKTTGRSKTKHAFCQMQHQMNLDFLLKFRICRINFFNKTLTDTLASGNSLF